MTLLVTGFEPFGGASRNPSADLLQRLQGAEVAGHAIETALLPCRFDTAGTALADAIAVHAPQLVLAVGQAGGRARLSFERVAINLLDARIPDNAGAQPVGGPVVPGAPPAYFATLPVKAMVAAARAVGVPAELSLSAGTFVCNAAFFQLMHALEGTSVRGGFLHIPLLPEQAAQQPGTPSMSLELVHAGVLAALAAAIATEEDLQLPGGSIC